MTVKCVSDFGKTAIAYAFSVEKVSINDLAVRYDRSRRTIMRVLEEKGVAPVKRKYARKPKVTVTTEATKIGDISALFNTADFDVAATGTSTTRPTKRSETFFFDTLSGDGDPAEAIKPYDALPNVIPTKPPLYRRIINKVVELFN